MSLENDFSYDGDSDVQTPRNGTSSKMKRKRNKKHRGGSKSPSPRKTKKTAYGDEIDNDYSHDSQADQAKRVADFIKGGQSPQKKHVSKSHTSYKPLATTR